MFNKAERKDKLAYRIYGIYVDWQIDNNCVNGLGDDPHGIECFENFIGKSGFGVAEVEVDGRRMLSINLTLKRFSLLEMIHIKVIKVIMGGINGEEAETALLKLSSEKALDIFDILRYYLSKGPWNLVTKEAFNGNSDDSIIEDSFLNSGRIIVKVMLKDGSERIISVNDILGGKAADNEYLIDSRPHGEEDVDRMELYWSERLGIPVIKNGDEIDFDYVYSIEQQ